MPDQPPATLTGKKNQILGLPLWAWGIGGGAFIIAIFIFFRQSQKGAAPDTSAQQISTAPAGATSPTVYPFNMGPTPGGNDQSQKFGKAILTDPNGYLIPLAQTPGGAPVAWEAVGTKVDIAGSPIVSKWGNVTYLSEPIKFLGGDFYANTQNLLMTSDGSGGGDPVNTASSRINAVPIHANAY